jgi:DNA polymerase elongation subunit (family B)
MKVLEIFQEKLRYKNYSPKTITVYCSYLSSFLIHNKIKDPYQVTTKQIIEFLESYNFKSTSQQNQYIGCLKETLPFDDKTDLRCFESESELILDFKRELIENDCDIITGYNMFYFDEKYIWDRCVEIL